MSGERSGHSARYRMFATVAEAGAYRRECYLRRTGENYRNHRMVVEDLHDGNVLIDDGGELHVIDPVLFVAGSG